MIVGITSKEGKEPGTRAERLCELETNGKPCTELTAAHEADTRRPHGHSGRAHRGQRPGQGHQAAEAPRERLQAAVRLLEVSGRTKEEGEAPCGARSRGSTGSPRNALSGRSREPEPRSQGRESSWTGRTDDAPGGTMRPAGASTGAGARPRRRRLHRAWRNLAETAGSSPWA